MCVTTSLWSRCLSVVYVCGCVCMRCIANVIQYISFHPIILFCALTFWHCWSPIGSYLDFRCAICLFWLISDHFSHCCIHLPLHPPTSPLPLSFSSVIALVLWGSGCHFDTSGLQSTKWGLWLRRLLPHIPFSASLTSPALPELIKNLLDNEQLRAD